MIFTIHLGGTPIFENTHHIYIYIYIISYHITSYHIIFPASKTNAHPPRSPPDPPWQGPDLRHCEQHLKERNPPIWNPDLKNSSRSNETWTPQNLFCLVVLLFCWYQYVFSCVSFWMFGGFEVLFLGGRLFCLLLFLFMLFSILFVFGWIFFVWGEDSDCCLWFDVYLLAKFERCFCCVYIIWRLVDDNVGTACRIGVPQIPEASTVSRKGNGRFQK